MLKQAKLGFLQTSERLGLSKLLFNTEWRRQRLLILCYHGTSLDDEHQWNGELYLSPEVLRKRLQALREHRCNVLPLDEAVTRLYAGNLPDRSVVITFDDGSYDFYKVAWPIVRDFGFPVTLYFTTYYSDFNRPVFDTMCSYLLWKARDRQHMEWPEVLAAPALLDGVQGRNAAARALKTWAQAKGLSGREKDDLLSGLAERLGIDYEELCRRRVLHLVTSEEAREMASEGLDIQLHTHRHRVWRRRDKFVKELEDNRQRIAAATPVEPHHFCYTGGFYLPEFAEYLESDHILSATTCKSGLCTPQSDRMFLPRLVDTMGLTDLEFRAWLTGSADLLPRRAYQMSEGQLMEEDTPVSTVEHV